MIKQGQIFDNGKSFVVLVCTLDDVICEVEEMGIKLTENQIKEAFTKCTRHLDDACMESFHDGVKEAIFEVDSESK